MEAAWLEEAQRRYAELQSGRVKAVPADEVIRKARADSPTERLELIGTLWDSLPHADLAVTETERTLLDARLKDTEENPGNESPWSEVQARLQKPRR